MPSLTKRGSAEMALISADRTGRPGCSASEVRRKIPSGKYGGRSSGLKDRAQVYLCCGASMTLV